ncbi:MAG: hypothetical protein Q9168_003546 [Polycauliona sp. 1 TL-2023]
MNLTQYPIEDPVIDPEDHPIPDIQPWLNPYDASTYSRMISHIYKYIDDYKSRRHYRHVCPSDETNLSACQPCIGYCLFIVAGWLTHLLNTAPSSDIPTEYDDLRRLDLLAKALMQVEGNYAHWVHVLIERKCKSLRGTMLAEQMGKRDWSDEEAVLTEDATWDQVMVKSGLRSRIKAIWGDVTATRQIKSETLLSELAASGVPAADLATTLDELLGVDLELILESDDEETDDEETDEDTCVLLGQDSSHSDEAVVEDGTAPATTAMQYDIDRESSGQNELVAIHLRHWEDHGLYEDSNDDIGTPASFDDGYYVHPDGSMFHPTFPPPLMSLTPQVNGPGEPTITPVTLVSASGLDGDKSDLDDESIAPMHGTETQESMVGKEERIEAEERGDEANSTEEEAEEVEDAFFASRRPRGVGFDVVEREPGEVRAPAPPQPRARRWGC